MTLRKFEEYTETRGGQSFEIFWNISVNDTKIEVPCPSHDHPILIIPKLYRADFLNKLLPDSMQDFKRRLLANKEYAWILEGCKKYPLLMDDKKNVLSFPPIINSSITGKIEEIHREILGLVLNSEAW